MGKFLDWMKHPFGQAVALSLGAFLFFKYGIPLFPGSAPVPNSVVLQFTATALVGVLVFVSENEERWKRFKEPIQATLVDADKRALRGVLLATIPLLVGLATFNMTRPKVGSTAQLRSIHPAPPTAITLGDKTFELAGLENPLRSRGSMEEHYLEGRRVYYQDCLLCHGDLLDGQGPFAHGFNPAPLAFEAGTIDQLEESFLFWRIAKGGRGLPPEGTPWNSAMPVWEDFLTEDEIWAVIIFIYEQTGLEPRTWEVEGEEH
jgi:mono/diheme cytochrome c family protein